MKKQKRTLRRFKDSNDMVSEVIGTVLLLGITVALFSTLYVTVISHPAPPDPTFVNLVGTVEGNNIILEHRGGDPLDLDTKISITIGDEIKDITIGDENYLDEDTRSDNQWNVGERLVYPFEYNLDNAKAEVLSVDGKSNSIIMTGTIDITPECDIGLKQTTDTRFPPVGSTVIVTTKATMYWGNIDATSVIINNILPDNLDYQSHLTNQGCYDSDTGIWEIDSLVSGGSVMLDISAIVTSTGVSEFTQLAILLDGSSTINSDEWDIMRTGLADAVEEPIYFPHDGSVELTIIQFGGNDNGGDSPRAKIEIGPIIVNDNYMDISNDIRSLDKIGGMTPTPCAIYLAADTLSSSPNFDANTRQIINLVTDGKPNCVWSGIPGDYTGNPGNSGQSKESTESARDYLLSKLEMTDNKDEFDAEAIGPVPEIDWLRDSIVWPGSYEWESTSPSPPGPGWVRAVSDYDEFASGVHELFDILFGDIIHSAEIISSTPIDVDAENNKASGTITPILP